MPGKENISTPTNPNISFGPKRVEKRQEQTAIEKITTVLVALAVLSTILSFGYRYFLESRLSSIQQQIVEETDATTDEMYESVRSFDRTARAVRFFLGNRMDVTQSFHALEESVSQSVFYRSFEGSVVEDGITMSLGGVSPEFAKIVLQSNNLGFSTVLKNVVISRIELRKTDTATESMFTVSAHVPKERLLIGKIERKLPVSVPSGSVVSTTSTTTVNSVIE